MVALPKFQILPSQNLEKYKLKSLNQAAADAAVQQKLCPNFKFTFSKNLDKYDPISVNHAAIETAVQRKLCPNFKFHLPKNLEKRQTSREGSLKTPFSATYNKIHFRLLFKKLNDHYNSTIINRYKNSGLSSEAQLITNELLVKANNSTHFIAENLLALTPTKISIMIQILSNHNSLNYHNTKCNLAYTHIIHFVTTVQK